MRIFKVGGAVRDQFLDLKSKDIDLAVEAKSFDEMREEVIRRNGKIYVETPQYFTIRAKLPTLGDVDFSLCRRDGIYKDGRHPESVEPASILDDLARRDFTINAIDIDTNETLDPHNGIEDIVNKTIKCVGDPHLRFEEDSLRILRALRFHITKRFHIHDDTVEAMYKNKHNLLNLPVERIRDEFYRMFKYHTFSTLKAIDRFELGFLFRDLKLELIPTIHT